MTSSSQTSPDMAFEDFEVGDVVSFTRCFSLKDFETFSALSGDTNPMHGDPSYAARSNQAKPTVPLQLAAAPLSAVAGAGFGRHRSLCLTTKLKSVEPIFYGQDITYSAKIASKHPGSSTLTLSVIAFQSSVVLLSAEMLVKILDDVPPAPVPPHSLRVESASHSKAALITGATGPIGRSTARRMAKNGWDLALQFKSNKPAADRLKKELSEAGTVVEIFQASLDDIGQTAGLVESVNRNMAPVAFLHLASPPLDAPAADQSSVHYEAGRQIMDELLPEMLRRQQGTIMILGSEGVEQGHPGWEDFIVTKNAASGFARQIEVRFREYGVRGKTVAPGFVDTPFSQAFRPCDARLLLAEEVAEAIVDHLENIEPNCPGLVLLKPGYGYNGIQKAAVAATDQSVVSGIPENSPYSVAAPSSGARATGTKAGYVEALVRAFFKLAPSFDLEDGGLGYTPGWDSLAHIELMIFLESNLGITFTSQEMATGTGMQILASIAERKLA